MYKLLQYLWIIFCRLDLVPDIGSQLIFLIWHISFSLLTPVELFSQGVPSLFIRTLILNPLPQLSEHCPHSPHLLSLQSFAVRGLIIKLGPSAMSISKENGFYNSNTSVQYHINFNICCSMIIILKYTSCYSIYQTLTYQGQSLLFLIHLC